MLLFVGERVLASCLTRQKAPWVTNLPPDLKVVGCRVDQSRGGLVFTIRSDTFRRVARGAPTPELEAKFNGLVFAR
jgi:hypothetical protein